jgi:hypothetical protein
MGIFRMFKWVLGFVFLLCLLAVGAVIGYFQIDRLAKQAIERGGSFALGTPTHVESASLKVMAGELGLNRLRVENPPGFTDPLFIEVEDGVITLKASSLLTRRVEVPRIELNRLNLHLEHSSGGANYEKILENIERLKESLPRVSAAEKKYLIEEIVMRDITVFAATRQLAFLRPLRITIEEITLVDVSSDSPDGMVMGQIQGIIVRAILQAVLREAGSIFSPSVAAALSGESGPRTSVRGIRVEGAAVDDAIDAARRGIESILRGRD